MRRRESQGHQKQRQRFKSVVRDGRRMAANAGRVFLLICVVGLGFFLSQPTSAGLLQQSQDDSQSASDLPDEKPIELNANSPVAAWVDDQPIYVHEVELQIREATRGQQVVGAALQRMQAEGVEQLIGQRLVLKYLAEEKYLASDDDLKLAITKIQRQLEISGRTMEQYLARREINVELLKRQLMWRLSWSEYLEERLTDENLKAYFDQHKAEFDGTKRRIYQIFISPQLEENNEKSADEEVPELTGERLQDARRKAYDRAVKVREMLDRDEETFSELARVYSDSPTARSGGEVGWFTRDGELASALLESAFELQKGAVSEPIETPYGWHLVTWDAEQPGQLTWQAAGDRLKLSATRFLFEWIVETKRKEAKVKYSDAYPHFQSGSRQVIEAIDR